MNKKYEYIVDNNLVLSRAVRNSFMSEVTNSPHKSNDNKEALDSFSIFKDVKRLKVIEVYTDIKNKTKEFADIIPNIILFFETINKID
jgi:hypothetical protein